MRDYATLNVKEALKPLKGWIGIAQLITITAILGGEEEGEAILNLCLDMSERIAAMPKTYETDGQGDETIVHLHYFTGGCDWYILEKDSDPDGAGQVQAFGLADLFQDGGEFGYISIPDILAAGAELDLYWHPITLGELQNQRAKRYGR